MMLPLAVKGAGSSFNEACSSEEVPLKTHSVLEKINKNVYLGRLCIGFRHVLYVLWWSHHCHTFSVLALWH